MSDQRQQTPVVDQSLVSRTVEVRGGDVILDRELLEMYFENARRSGGGEIQTLIIDQQHEVAYVTFSELNVAENILKKTHSINDTAMKVTPYKPHRILKVSGFRQDVSCNMLQLYFEKITGFAEVKSVKLDSTSSALVTFADPIDLKSILDKEHIVSDNHLTVCLYTETSSTEKPMSSQSNSVSVRGFPASVTKDMLMNYFENNRRSGGDIITEIITDMKKRVAYITFENADAVRNVASRAHELGGCKLEVSVENPPEMMRDRVVLRGMQAVRSRDQVLMFLEVATSLCVKSLLFSEEDGVALVIFTGEIAFNKVQEDIAKEKLNGRLLTVEPVFVSNTLLARFSDDNRPSEETIKQYFANFQQTEMSLNGIEIHMGADGKYALVSFAEPQVAVSVARRRHAIQGHVVDLSMYTECLGTSGGSERPPLQRVNPIAFNDCENVKLSLLQTSPVMLQSLEDTLNQCHAKLELSDTSDRAVVTCTLTPSVKDAWNLITEWEEKTKRILEQYLNTVYVEHVDATNEEFKEVKDMLNEIANVERVHFKYDEVGQKILLVCDKAEDKNKIMNTRAKVSSALASIRKRNSEVCERIDMSEGKFMLIKKKTSWTEELKRFPDVDFRYNSNLFCIELNGQAEDVLELKVLLFENLNKILSRNHKWDSKVVTELLANSEARKTLVRFCTDRYSSTVLEFTTNGFIVSSFDEDELSAVVSCAKSAVITERVPLKKEYQNTLKSTQWEEFKKSLVDGSAGLLHMQENDDVLTVIGLNIKSLQTTVESLKTFLKENSLLQCSIPIEESLKDLFLPFVNENIARLRQTGDFRVDKVALDDSKSELVVVGDSESIMKIQEMKQTFDQRKLVVAVKLIGSGVEHVFTSTHCRRKFDKIEQKYKCKIMEGGQSSSADGDVLEVNLNTRDQEKQIARRTSAISTGLRAPKRISMQRHSVVPAMPPIVLRTFQDITMMDCTALVNSSNSSLQLDKGQVSRALLHAGGLEIQKECDTKYPNGIETGDIAVTGGGKLKCKYLFHCCLPETENKQQIQKVIFDTVQTCLAKADLLQLSSVGFPSLGTGILQYPPLVVAETMFKAAAKYFADHNQCHISEVIFVLYDKDVRVIKDFETVNAMYTGMVTKEKPRDVTPPDVEDDVINSTPAATEEKTVQHLYFDQHISAVTLVLAVLDSNSVEKIVKELERYYSKNITTKKISVPKLSEWDEKHINQVCKLCELGVTNISFFFTSGIMMLRGLEAKVNPLFLRLDEAIKEADQFASVKQQADLMAKQVRWSVIVVTLTGEELQAYSQLNNYYIEMAYRDGKKSVIVVNEANEPCNINFDTMEESPESLTNTPDTGGVTVIRQDLIEEVSGDIQPPSSWTWTDPKSSIDVVPLKEESEEYKRVKRIFKSCCPQKNMKVLEIRRVQNTTLYKQYRMFEKSMKRTLPTNRRCEKDELWHEISFDETERVVHYGFNRSIGDLSKNQLGKGVYFTKCAVDAADSNAKPNSAGLRCIFLCKVLVGEYTLGQKDMRIPLPEIKSDKGRYYNSTVDDVTNPNIYVAFHDAQAYPEYIINFRKRTGFFKSK